MTTNFPGALDDFQNPAGSEQLDNAVPGLKHSTQHGNANDALEALEAKVGIDASADPDSLDYRVRNGGSVRKTASLTTDSISADASDASKTLALGKGCMALRVATDYPAWVRVYSTEAACTADAGRAQDVDATGEHGVLLEVITASDNLGIDLSPAAVLFSAESVPGTALPVNVVNLDNQARAITVTVTALPLEG